MLSLQSKLNIEYNSKYDILYVHLQKSDDTYGDEKKNGIVLNYDYTSDILVGFDIWDFKLRMKNKEHIDLPVHVDLKEIYNNI